MYIKKGIRNGLIGSFSAMLALPLVGAAETTGPSIQAAGTVYSIPEAFTDKRHTAFTHNGKLFVAFQSSSGTIQITSLEGDEWSKLSTVKYKETGTSTESNLTSDNGVEGFSFQDSTSSTDKIACLMVMGSHRAKQSCTSNLSTSFVGDSLVTLHTAEEMEINGTVSARTSLEDPATVYIVGQSLQKEGDWYEPIKPNNYQISLFTCEGQDDNPTELTCDRNKLISGEQYKGPSVAVGMTSEGEDWLYSFYRDAEHDNKIHYYGDAFNVPSERSLTNSGGDTRSTDIATDSHSFNGNVYVAWRNANNAGVRYSKINYTPDDDDKGLDNDDNGKNDWTHCDVKNSSGAFIMESKTSPTIFDYNDELYILFSDKRNGNQLKYIKIVDSDGNTKC